MKIIVTGGAGFIGSNLVEKLLKSNFEVVVLDNFSTGKRENIASFADNRYFTLIEDDICDTAACRRAVAGCDIVFHLAALGSVPLSLTEPEKSVEVNVCGMVNMLGAAKNAGVGRFIYASSSSVYGDNSLLPQQEEHTGKALSPYALSKQCDELFADCFHSFCGIDTVGLRYFNVFGPRQDAKSCYAAVIPKFAAALLKHRRPTIYGDGSFSRDFTYVENVVDANLAALECPKAALNQVYNIAGAEKTTVLELFNLLRAELAQYDLAIGEIEPDFAPERQGDVPHSFADISKAKKLLGYQAKYSFAAGLKLTAKWYFDNFSKR